MDSDSERSVTVQHRPFPTLKVGVLASALFCNTFMSSMLLPFLTFMVDGFHIAPRPEDIGKYSGYLVASFMIGQAVFSYPWGYWSDTFGRRPILISGLVLTGVSFLNFGLSKSYYSALAWRFVNGAVNGIVGVTMTYMSEITDESNQAQGFAILGVSRASGVILGPIIGGFLSMPVQKYPWFFKPAGFFDEYPYVLPCIVGFTVSMTGGLLAILVLEETKSRRKPPTQTAQHQCDPSTDSSRQNATQHANQVVASHQISEDSDRDVDVEDDQCTETSPLLPAEEDIHAPANLPPEPLLDLLRRPSVLVSITLYFMLNSIYIQFDETFVLWSRMSISSGGINFKSSEQGIAFTTGGICLFLYQFFLYSAVERRLGTLKTFQTGLWISLPGFVIISLASLLASCGSESNVAEPSRTVWAIVGPSLAMRAVGGLQAFTCTFVMMSNSVTSRSRGSLNGFGQMMGALGRMTGPIIAGSLFSWSLQNGLAAPFDYHFNFLIIVAQQLLAFALSCWMPKSIDKRLPEESSTDPSPSEEV